jgi:hypothetical protein
MLLRSEVTVKSAEAGRMESGSWSAHVLFLGYLLQTYGGGTLGEEVVDLRLDKLVTSFEGLRGTCRRELVELPRREHWKPARSLRRA